uniref:Translation initiation factor eIF2B subunit beta n=1 Tax=Amblyomma triste TaxID=251400 RepID=A0A023GKQ4_AMBTT
MDAEAEARLTLSRLVQLVRDDQWHQAQELLDLVRARGKKLSPLSTSANVVRRVLRLIRDEYASAYLGRQVEADWDSLQKLLSARDNSVSDYTRPLPGLREQLLESLDELERELRHSAENVAAQGPEHIQSGDLLLTQGRSRAVEDFLKRAAQSRRTFQVLVAEGAPRCEGLQLAESLARVGIATTLVPDSAILALMPRVSKVILGTDSVLADGGLQAPCGSHALALAARHCAVPLLVCAPGATLSPQLPCSESSFQHLGSPEPVGPEPQSSGVVLLNPASDCVPPDLVPLLVTSGGGHATSYVYRLLSEVYHPDDHALTASCEEE